MARHVPHLYVESVLQSELGLSCSQDWLHRLRSVMRVREGSEVRLFNGKQGLWSARVHVEGKHLMLRVERAVKEQPLLVNDLTLYVPLIKPQRLGMLVRQVVELGVSRLVPYKSEYGGSSYYFNRERMGAVVISACEQSGRLLIPEMKSVARFEEVMGYHGESSPLYACLETGLGRERDMLKVVREDGIRRNAGIIIGPEGGFSSEERDWLCEGEGIEPVGLGRYILRSETAASLAVGLWLLSREEI